MEDFKPKPLAVCRTCLMTVGTGESFKELSCPFEKYGGTIRDILQVCIAEVDLSVSENAVICTACLDLLATTYEFKIKCLTTEEKIFDYKQKKNIPVVSKIDLSDVFEETVKSEEYYLDENDEIQPLVTNNQFICISNVYFNVKEELGEKSLQRSVQNDSGSDSDRAFVRHTVETDLNLLFNTYDINSAMEDIEEERLLLNEEHNVANENDPVDVINISSESEEDSDCENRRVDVETIADNPKIDVMANRNNVEEKDIQKQTDKPEKCLNCLDCGKKFKRRKHYGHHYYTHKGEFPYACDLCPFTCVYRNQLRRHQNEHSPKNFHFCPLCQKSFVNSYFLCEHLKIHENFNKNKMANHTEVNRDARTLGEEYKKCQQCQYGFYKESDRVLHSHWHAIARYGAENRQKNAMKLKIFSCAMCTYSTTVEQELKCHTASHIAS